MAPTATPMLTATETMQPQTQHTHGKESFAPRVQIRPYEPRDQQRVEALFTDGMLFYGTRHPGYLHLWQKYIRESIDDDLSKIQDVYIRPGGNFWVATTQKSSNDDDDGDDDDDADKSGNNKEREHVIAMVGLEATAESEGELRRMYVDAAYRRFGLGRVLVAHLEQWAKASGFARVTLSTDAFMAEACKFYASIGYEHTKTVDLRGGYEQLHYTKAL